MKSFTKSLLAAFALAAWASPAAAQSPSDWHCYCDIRYYHADNMWGSKAAAYKSRTFYGSHARVLANKGTYAATFFINEGGAFASKEIVLAPN